MGIAILLFLIFAGIEAAPLYGYSGNYPTLGPVKTYAFPLPGTTWVNCMNAVLNITFLWVPQILFPSFIAEMEQPRDFPKALAVLLVISVILFIVPPAIGQSGLDILDNIPQLLHLEVLVLSPTRRHLSDL